MKQKLKSIQIESFKGFRNFTISDFNNFNLLIGSNNYGKTSLLEAILLLKYLSAEGVLRMARIRESTRLSNRSISTYSALLNLFNFDDDTLRIALNYGVDKSKLKCEITGVIDEVSCDKQASDTSELYVMDTDFINEITRGFFGSIRVDVDGTQMLQQSIELLEREEKRNRFSNKDFSKYLQSIRYISNFERTLNPNIGDIIKDDHTKKEIINILNGIFDENYTDIKILEDKYHGYYQSLSIGSKNLPLNAFGEGVRQAIILMNGIINAKDGILLVDEIEGGLHKKAVDKLMPAILKYAKLYNVQVIATTHSEEVIDSVLGTYENEVSSYLDDINILRIIKDTKGNKQCLVRSGKEALTLRRDSGVDLG